MERDVARGTNAFLAMGNMYAFSCFTSFMTSMVSKEPAGGADGWCMSMVLEHFLQWSMVSPLVHGRDLK